MNFNHPGYKNVDSFSDLIARQQQEEDQQNHQWVLGDYVSEACPNCGRSRLCKCDNGKHRCEKCNWMPEDNKYCSVII